MSKEIPNWVKVDALVIESPYGFASVYPKPAKIVKVHKNGRFLIENDSRQWTPSGDYAVNRSSRFRYVYVHPFEGERKTLAQQSWVMTKYRRLINGEIERLEKVVRSNDFGAIEKEALKLETEPTP